MARAFHWAILGLLLIGGSIAAQKQGSIAGRILDRTNQPLPGATVTARTYTRGPLKAMLTRADGTYEFTGLADGLYQIDASLTGFEMARLNRVDVRGEPVRAADMPLDVSPICECIGHGWPGAQVILQGVIADERGDPLPHVRLTLSSGGTEAKGYADAAGRFRARVAESTVYVLATATPGFVTQRTTIRVREATRGPMTVPITLVSEPLPADLPPLERISQPCCEQGVFIHSRR